MLNIRSIIDAVHASLATAETVSQEIINVATEVRSLAHLGGQWTPDDETKLMDNVSRLTAGTLPALPAIVPTALEVIKTVAAQGTPAAGMTIADALSAHATEQTAPEPTAQNGEQAAPTEPPSKESAP